MEKTGVYKGKKLTPEHGFIPITAMYEEAIKNPHGERLPTKLNVQMGFVSRGRYLLSLAHELDKIYRDVVLISCGEQRRSSNDAGRKL